MKNKKVILVSIVIYCIFMLVLLFGRSKFDVRISYWEQVLMNINLYPFSSISQYIYVISHKTNAYLLPYAVINIWGNILAFIPYGFFLPLIFRRYKNFLRFFPLSLAVIVLLESIQLLSLRGCFDVDDIFLNLVGGIIGYIIFILFGYKNIYPTCK